ncbi:MAG: HAD-IA family hydrolase [Proteobacteria bacterium]|nr:HAD-IA family hydrolase [Pseudomonadota bacterium]
MVANSIRWILFDLGNVLVEYKPDGFSKLSKYLGVNSNELDVFFNANSALQNIVKGVLSPDQFVGIINTQYDSSLTEDEIVDLFCPDVKCIFQEIPTLVASLKCRYSLGILSNTFFGHWDYFKNTKLANEFHVLLASHILGYTKPDPKIFSLALERIGASPEQVLFIDDKKENVDAAKAIGIASFQSLSPNETISGLRRFEIDV